MSDAIRYVRRDEVGYPAQLRELHDPPEGLFLRGRDLPPADRLIAMVGARACSLAGTELARSVARGLARAGLVVVSGAARGIDSAAHEGSLDGGAPTVAVLGSGIDVPYPRGSSGLIDRIADLGTVVSEYPPGVPAMAFRFPARNRIVVGLSRALIVVEGEEGSGSLISAEHALDLGKDVFAFPGAVTNPLAAVPNALIRDGAALVRGVDDLLSELGLASSPDGTATRPTVDLTPFEQQVLEHVSDRTLPDSIASALEVDVAAVLPALLRLELVGLLRSVGGRYERRIAASHGGGA